MPIQDLKNPIPLFPLPEDTLHQIPLGVHEHHVLGFFERVQELKAHSSWKWSKSFVPNKCWKWLMLLRNTFGATFEHDHQIITKRGLENRTVLPISSRLCNSIFCLWLVGREVHEWRVDFDRLFYCYSCRTVPAAFKKRVILTSENLTPAERGSLSWAPLGPPPHDGAFFSWGLQSQRRELAVPHPPAWGAAFCCRTADVSAW